MRDLGIVCRVAGDEAEIFFFNSYWEKGIEKKNKSKYTILFNFI